jgi:hypothetical protein
MEIRIMKKRKLVFRYLVSGVILTGLISSLLPIGVNDFAAVQRAFAKAENGRERSIREKEAAENFVGLPVYFEENRGQFDKRATYLARGTTGHSLFLSPASAVYLLRERSSLTADLATRRSAGRMDWFQNNDRRPRRAAAVFMRLVGGNEKAASVGSQELEHRTNYFKGRSENWRTDIPNYGQVRFEDVYPGTDLIWRGNSSGFAHYDLELSPGAVPERIEWEIRGANRVELSAEGDLVIGTDLGEIRQPKPSGRQDREGMQASVEIRYVIRSDRSAEGGPVRVGFQLGEHDRKMPLRIAPEPELTSLAYSTFLGGIDDDVPLDIAIDSVGNAYVAGFTFSADYPATSGSFDDVHNGNLDAFVTKLNGVGSGLLYSTFLGGTSDEIATSIAINSLGEAYITGFTNSSAYPVAGVPFDPSYNGGMDVFVTKLNALGNLLDYSTFIGDIGGDFGEELVIDSSGAAYVTGHTISGSFPTTAGAFQTTSGGGVDAFALKLDPSGSALIYSTFLGGFQNDYGYSIAVDNLGAAFITGHTFSTNFPVTTGAFDLSPNGNLDAFATKLSPTGSSLNYSTYIGGIDNDFSYGIAIDGAGSAYVTGVSSSVDYPATTGAYDTSQNGGSDVVVTKLNPAGSALVYSTFIGGGNDDGSYNIVVDSLGSAYVVGFALSSDYPVTTGAYDPSFNGILDVIASRLSAAGDQLLYSTYIGNVDLDEGIGIAVDNLGAIYVTGRTESTGYPTTSGVFDNSHNGSQDAFVTKFAPPPPTAARVSIGGRVFDDNGFGVRNATVTLVQSDGTTLTTQTSSFGYYTFEGVEAGQTAVIAVRSRTRRYAPVMITVSEDLTGVDFYPSQ